MSLKALFGSLEIAAGAVLTATGVGAPVGAMLIGAGVGQVIAGLGTMLETPPISGIATATRSPIAPYRVMYGRNRVGGTLVYQWNWGALANTTSVDYRRMLDMVFVLACHPCQNEINDSQIFFDQKRLIVSPFSVPTGLTSGYTHPPEPNSGTSYLPQKQNVNIASIQRDGNGVVTVLLTDVIDVYFPPSGVIDYIQSGDTIQINDTDSSGTTLADNNLAGIFTIAQILSADGEPTQFTVLDGGPACGPFTAGDAAHAGIVNTYVDWGDGQGSQPISWAKAYTWAYVEFLSGTQKLPTTYDKSHGTFVGQLIGTPWNGNVSKMVSPEIPNQAGSYGGNEVLNILSFTILGGNDEVNAMSNPWDANCTLVNKTAAFVRLTYSTNTPNGQPVFSAIPQISFHMKGRNQIYDPRLAGSTPNWSTDQTAVDTAFASASIVTPLVTNAGPIDIANPNAYGYTENAALCIADFLTNVEWGYSLQYETDIPTTGTTGLIAAANICDESVDVLIGGTEPRYALNGSFTLDQKRGQILEDMLSACAGRLVYSQGQYYIQPAQWVTPGSTPINLTDISVGDFKWRPNVSRKDLPNRVAGTYISPYSRWTSTDFPAYAQDWMHNYDPEQLLTAYSGDINLAKDLGQRRTQQINLPFTISSSTAQRIAKIEMLRQRWQGTGSFTLNMSGYQFQVLDTIKAIVPVLGWTTEEPVNLEISSVRLLADKSKDNNDSISLSVEIDVQYVDPSIYDWSVDEELNPEGDQVTFASANYVHESIPLPWSPGYEVPLSGDAYVGQPASFGIQPIYSLDSAGNTSTLVQVTGESPVNVLYDDIIPPFITATPLSTGGTIPAGDYVVSASGFDSSAPDHKYTPYCNYSHVSLTGSAEGIGAMTLVNGGSMFSSGDVVDISGGTGGQITVDDATTIVYGPGGPGGVINSWHISNAGTGYSLGNVTGYKSGGGAGGCQFTITSLVPTGAGSDTNSIVANISWGPGDGGGQLYMAKYNTSSADSYVFHPVGSALDGSESSVTITSFDQTTGPEVDPMFDHLGVCYQPVIHGGPWADQVTNVTSTTLTFGCPNMTLNQWAGYTIGLLAKYDPTAVCPWVNIPIISSTASDPVTGEFILTIGPGPDGNTIDPTQLAMIGEGGTAEQQLIEVDDLLCMRHNPTFTSTSFTDPGLANGFYPTGMSGMETGHLVVVLNGVDAGDIQTIANVTAVDGMYTTVNLVGTWQTTPNTGDLVMVCGPTNQQDAKTNSINSPSPTVLSLNSQSIADLMGGTWLFRVRAEDVHNNYCADQYAPWRDLYFFRVAQFQAVWNLATAGQGLAIGNDIAPHYNVRAQQAGLYTKSFILEASGNAKQPGGNRLPLVFQFWKSSDNGATWISLHEPGDYLTLAENSSAQYTLTTFSEENGYVEIGDMLRVDLEPGSDWTAQNINLVVRWGVSS